jgi:squalene-associated FAD-dependent desaturase
MEIAVIGGGISGIRAALTLARAGRRVTLFEKNRHLGGRVFSFTTAEFGEIDIGQHIWLKCCTALEGLLRDLAVPDDWVYRQERFSLRYKRPGGPDFVLGSSPLPGLLHALPSLLRFPGLGWGDLFRLARGMARARLYTDRSLEALDAVSFAEWLRQHGQTPAAVTRLWEPIVLGVCNGRPDEVSARYALFTFRESLLKSKHAADFRLLRRPLSAVFDRQARAVLAEAGVDVRTGTVVRAVHPGTPPAVVVDGMTHGPGRVVLALPLRRMRGLLPDSERLPEPPPEGAIAGLLLKFARPVLDELFFMALDSPVQIVFNKTAIWTGGAGADEPQLVEVVISVARREARLGVEAVAAELLPELAKLLPRVAGTPLLATRLLVHGTATFGVPAGGSPRLPPELPEYPGIIVAGDQAATGWPSTMESAARAGETAAQIIIARS